MDFGKLGFGFLRLPRKMEGEERVIDLETVKEMADLFLQRGFCYFDTAYTYQRGKSEETLRKAVVERYPRDRFMIATKLPCGMLKKGKTPEEIFREQLDRCGVTYFDVYLLHGLDGEDADYAESQGCFQFLQEKKQTGQVRYTGFSFHGSARELDRILTRHPEVDVVQIQLNYLDLDHPIIQSGPCYEVCRKHNKPIIVMEPVKGGTLANVPREAEELFAGEKPAHRAIRFAASQPGVALVLSGMSTPEQLRENTGFMSAFTPLTQAESDVLPKATEIIRNAVAISCTGCGYCLENCPQAIPIPQYFALYNERACDGWQVDTESRYQKLAEGHTAAKDCIGCGNCTGACPQKLPVTDWLKKVSAVYDK